MHLRSALLVMSLVACSPPKAPRVPVYPREANLVVNDVYISTPTPVPLAEVDVWGRALAPQRATVELTVTVPLDCEPGAFSVDQLEGFASEVSGFDDHGVTYLVPTVAVARCEPSAPREYVLSLVWMKRSDVAWTIAVTPYVGNTDRVPGTALFARALAGYVATRLPRTNVIAVETAGGSLDIGPEIDHVVARGDGSELSITLDLVYENDCAASYAPWRLDIASSRAGDSAFMWGTLVSEVRYACGEVYRPVPVTVEYRVPMPLNARTIFLAIPNVDMGKALPVFHQTFRSRSAK